MKAVAVSKKFVNLDNGELRVDGVKDIKASTEMVAFFREHLKADQTKPSTQ